MKKELEAVRAKVIEAVPEIRRRVFADTTIEKSVDREITLADVLRAIPLMPEASFNSTLIELLRVWNLALPLDEQEPEVIEFLAKILL